MPCIHPLEMNKKSANLRRDFGPLRSVPSYRPSPFLKWAGGKGQLIRQMRQFFPSDFNTYYEPFLGGGAVFFHILPDDAVLSDLNEELVNTYQMVRNKPKELMAALDEHYPHRRSRQYFLKIRAHIPEDLNGIERAARTIFLNRTCYNGLYRVNSDGEFNVPFGNYSNPSLYNIENILAASRALKGKSIVRNDYRNVCKDASKNDFIYMDPPYQPLSKTAAFTAYTKCQFDESDQEDLARFFKRMDKRGCRLMLSNSSTEFVRSLYADYNLKSVRAKRAINCKVSGRKAIDELLVMNYW